MTSKSRIYTKTGDNGTTRLVDGSRVEKSSPRVEAYGCVDELNSCLGEVRYRLGQSPALASGEIHFERIQNQLFNLGSLMACENAEVLSKLPPLREQDIEALEKQMDLWDESLPPLKEFILPAGHPAAVALHLARTVCRRAERRCAEIALKDPQAALPLIYLNRLSDFLFMASRWANHATGTPEVTWKK